MGADVALALAAAVLFGAFAWTSGLYARSAAAMGDLDGSTLGDLLLAIVVFTVLLATLSLRRVVAERRLRRAHEVEESARNLLFERSDELVTIADFDARLLDVNPAWKATLGWEREAILGTSFLDLVHPDDRAETIEATRDLSGGGRVKDFQNRYRTADGLYRWLRWRAVPDLAQRRIYAIAHDVTEERTARARILRAHRRLLAFRRLIDVTNDAIYVIDPETARFVDVNRTACRRLGYSRAELLRRGPVDISPTLDSKVAFDAHVAGLDLDKNVVVETDHVDKEGVLIPMEVAMHAVDMGGRRYIVGVARDVAERRQAEDELRRQHEALREAQEIRSRLINSVVHDIAQPLTPLLLQIDMLPRLIDDDTEKAKARVALLRRNILRLNRLAGDMLEFGRMDADRFDLRPTRIDLAEVAQATVDDLVPAAAEHGVWIETRLQPCPLTGDPDRLTQVFANLITNALKFSPRETHVEVEVGSQNGHAEGRVVDHGRGLDADEAARLFRPFSQVHRPHETKEIGMGLGLYITKHIVEAHGGEVWVESDGRGEGATFTFRLPPTTALEGPVHDGAAGNGAG